MGTINNGTRRAAALRKWVLTSFGMACIVGGAGCFNKPPPQYGVERPSFMPGVKRQVWAVAPVQNLSGEKGVDPLLQADLVYQQLQQVQGLTVIPVNRTAEVFASLRLEKVQSEEQAALVCDLLGCDGLVVTSVTAYDPYNPPKLGAAVQLFRKRGDFARQAGLSPREMAKMAAPPDAGSLPRDPGLLQVVGMYDAQNGSVRSALTRYAEGRNDPVGPYAAKEYLVSMDRYCGFVYHVLIADLLVSPKLRHALE